MKKRCGGHGQDAGQRPEERLADNPALELLALLILLALGIAEVKLRSALAFAELVPFLSREKEQKKKMVTQ